LVYGRSFEVFEDSADLLHQYEFGRIQNDLFKTDRSFLIDNEVCPVGQPPLFVPPAYVAGDYLRMIKGAKQGIIKPKVFGKDFLRGRVIGADPQYLSLKGIKLLVLLLSGGEL
jgi:hypothetical protein